MSCISGAAVRAAGTVASGAICSAGLDTRTSDSMTGRPERVLVAPQPVEAAGLFTNLLKLCGADASGFFHGQSVPPVLLQESYKNLCDKTSPSFHD